MKSITDILNSMVQTHSDPSGFSNKGLSAASHDSNNVGSFSDVLSRLKTESAGTSNNASSTTNHADSSSASITSVPVNESVQSANSSSVNVADIEKSVTSLAVSLAKLVHLASSFKNVTPAQAQKALVAASGGTITSAQAQDLLNQIAALKNENSAQNPLTLTAGQQNALLIQMMQTMLQSQQVTVTQGSEGKNGTNSATSGSTPNLGSLQLDFSGTRADQGSDILSIDLKSLSLQSADKTAVAGNSLTQATTDRLTNLLQQLQVTPSSEPVEIDVRSAAGAANDSAGLNENFKNLVQILTQAGAGQAVLNTFLTQQKNNPSAQFQPTSNQSISPENLFNTALPSVEIPPVTSTDLTQAFGATAQNTQSQTADQSQAGPVVHIPENLLNASVSSAPIVDTASAVETNVAPQIQLVKSSVNQTLVDQPAQAPVASTPVNQEAVSQVSQVLQAPVVSTATITNQSNIEIPNTQTVLAQSDTTAINATNKPSDQNQTTVVGGHLEALNNIVARFNGGVVLGKVAASNTLRSPSNTGLNSLTDQNVVTKPVVPAVAVNTSRAEVAASNTVQKNTGSNTADVQVQLTQTTSPATQKANGNLDTALKNEFVQTNSNNINSGSTINNEPALTPVSLTATTQENGSAPAPNVVQQTIAPNGNTVQVSILATGTTINAPVTVVSTAPVVTSPVTVTQPTSTALNIPATAVVGEAVKASVPPPAVENTNVAANNAQVVTSVSTVSAVQPTTAQAVTQASTVIESTADTKTSSNLDKNTAADTITLQNAMNTAVANLSAQTDKANNNFQAVTANAEANRNPNSNVDSAQILSQISQQVAAQTAAAKTITQLNFQLMPASLGRVTVQVALVDQSVSARIVVSSPEVREALQQHMVELKAALSQAGLQIDQLQVQVQGGGSSLLAQYYQYQQEGGAYRSPVSVPVEAFGGAETLENIGVLGNVSSRNSLVNLLA